MAPSLQQLSFEHCYNTPVEGGTRLAPFQQLEVRHEPRDREEMPPPEPHGQPGTFLVGFGKPSLKLHSSKRVVTSYGRRKS